jgi:hypothetical protein
MSKNKEIKIRRPRGGVNSPEAKIHPEFETIPQKADKKAALKEWLKSAKNSTLEEAEEVNSGIIDPKQAAYAKKRRKK